MNIFLGYHRDLSYNLQLIGSLPQTLGNLTKLKKLWVYTNPNSSYVLKQWHKFRLKFYVILIYIMLGLQSNSNFVDCSGFWSGLISVETSHMNWETWLILSFCKIISVPLINLMLYFVLSWIWIPITSAVQFLPHWVI